MSVKHIITHSTNLLSLIPFRCTGFEMLRSCYLDWHGICGAVQSSPQRLFNSVNALISVTRHLNVWSGQGEKNRVLFLMVTLHNDTIKKHTNRMSKLRAMTKTQPKRLHMVLLVPALILTACGVSRLLMLSISTFLSSSVRSNPSRMEGSLRSKRSSKSAH